MSHILELRKRLLITLAMLLLVFCGLLPFANSLYTFASEPLQVLLPQGSHMIATSITSPFMAPLKLTAAVAAFITMPVFLYQAWCFIAPALYAHEKKHLLPVLCGSWLLFYAGVAFAYGVAFPLIMKFFLFIGPESIQVMPDIHAYLSMALTLFFAFGMAFQIPMITLVLVITGMASINSIRQKRPYVIIMCFIVGMLLTPPDVMSQLLLALPMWFLFELGLLLASLCYKPSRASR